MDILESNEENLRALKEANKPPKKINRWQELKTKVKGKVESAKYEARVRQQLREEEREVSRQAYREARLKALKERSRLEAMERVNRPGLFRRGIQTQHRVVGRGGKTKVVTSSRLGESGLQKMMREQRERPPREMRGYAEPPRQMAPPPDMWGFGQAPRPNYPRRPQPRPRNLDVGFKFDNAFIQPKKRKREEWF